MILRNTIVLVVFLSSTISIAETKVDLSEHQIDKKPIEEKQRSKTYTTSERPVYKSTTTNQTVEFETSSSFRTKTTDSPFDGTKTQTFREKFSVSGNESNSTVGLAIEILYQKMAEVCPSGWTKAHEWVEASKGNFYLNYEISCISMAIRKY